MNNGKWRVIMVFSISRFLLNLRQIFKLNYNLHSLRYLIELSRINIDSTTQSRIQISVYVMEARWWKISKLIFPITFSSNRCTTKSELLSTRTPTSEKFAREIPGEKRRKKCIIICWEKFVEIRVNDEEEENIKRVPYARKSHRLLSVRSNGRLHREYQVRDPCWTRNRTDSKDYL